MPVRRVRSQIDDPFGCDDPADVWNAITTCFEVSLHREWSKVVVGRRDLAAQQTGAESGVEDLDLLLPVGDPVRLSCANIKFRQQYAAAGAASPTAKEQIFEQLALQFRTAAGQNGHFPRPTKFPLDVVCRISTVSEDLFHIQVQ